MSRPRVPLLPVAGLLSVAASLWNGRTFEHPDVSQRGFQVEGGTVLQSLGFAVKQNWVRFPHLPSLFLALPHFARLVLLSIK